MIKLDSPGVAPSLAQTIKRDIDKYCVDTYDDGHREHLGASQIGNECKRFIWLVFRWCGQQPTSGRQQRLFNRGHREEARYLEWLRGIGCTVSDVTEDGKQHRISDCKEHFGGSLDGMGTLPPRYEIDEEILFEFKTKGTGKGFVDLCSMGMIIKEPVHYAQTCVYGFKKNLNYCAYFTICKNDDDLHIEIVKLDHKLGEQLIAKAETIIFSQEPPPRLSDNPTFYKCQNLCNLKMICHGGEEYEKNCRSCSSAFPVDNAEWLCSKFNGNIPKEFIRQGCPEYSKIG